MATTEEVTTLVCLFHHKDQASAAVQDLLKDGVPRAAISSLDNDGGDINPASTLDEYGIPERDRQHLLDGLGNGGVIVAVSSIAEHVSTVEKIFGRHNAKKIDEAAVATAPDTAPIEAIADGASIPVVEEELLVGKRTVDQGGVRVYRRIVEVPVSTSVDLREEHITLERHAVNRPTTDADLALQGERTIELTETAEEAFVAKTAHVVEEVVVGKTQTERTAHLEDTVRRTEVEIEEIAPENHLPKPTQTF